MPVRGQDVTFSSGPLRLHSYLPHAAQTRHAAPSTSPAEWIAGRFTPLSGQPDEEHRVVFRACDQLFRREVALKGVLIPDQTSPARAPTDSHAPTSPRPALLPQLWHEFERLRALEHPRLAQLYEVGVAYLPAQAAWFHYSVQEWIDGPSLRALRGELSLEALETLARETLSLLAWLHTQHLTRLDLKSDHLLHTDAGWRLIDLDELRPDAPLDPTETQGTLHYLAPEVLEGQPGGPLSDLYSLGVVLYEAATGQLPLLPGRTLDEIRLNLKRSPVPELPASLLTACTDSGSSFATLVTRLLSRSAAQRPPDAEQALLLLGEPDGHWRRQAPLPSPPRVESLAAVPAPRASQALVLSGPAESGRSQQLRAWAHAWQAQGIPALLLTQKELLELPPQPLAAIHCLLQHLQSLPWQSPSSNRALQPHPSAGPPLSPTSAPADPLATPLPELPADAPSPAPGRDPSPVRAGQSLQEDTEALICDAVEKMRRAGQRASRACSTGEPPPGTPAPIPLLIDELSCLDESSRAVLQRLIPVLANSGLLLVTTELDTQPLPWPGVQRFSPPPMTLNDVRAFVEAIPGLPQLTPAQLELLLKLSEGRLRRVRTRVERLWQQWPMLAGSSDPAVLNSWLQTHWQPKDQELQAQELLHALPAGARQWLPVMAVLTPPFTASMLETVLEGALLEGVSLSGTPPETFTASPFLSTLLAQLAGQGVLLPRGHAEDGVPQYTFARELLRQALVNLLPDASARALHQQAAALLEASLDPSPSAIAEQLLKAGAHERARPYLQQAIDQALKRLCPEEALSLLGQLKRITPQPSAASLELVRRQGELELELARFDASAQTLRTGLEAHPSAPPARRQALELLLGRALICKGELTAGMEVLERSLPGAPKGEGRLPQARVQAQHLLAWAYLQRGQGDRASQLLRELEPSGLPPDSRLALDHLYYVGCVAARTDHPEGQLCQQLEQSLPLAQRLGYARGEIRLLNLLGELSLLLGDLDTCQSSLSRLLEKTRARFDVPAEASIHHNLALLALERGDEPAAFALFEQAALLYHRTGNLLRERRSWLDCAHLLLKRGQLDRCEAELQGLAPFLDHAGLELSLPYEFLRLSLQQQLGQGAGPELWQQLQDRVKVSGKTSLLLDVVLERMQQAHAHRQPREVLALYQSLGDLKVSRLNARAWTRVHEFAAEAHLALRPLPPAGTATAPGSESDAVQTEPLPAATRPSAAQPPEPLPSEPLTPAGKQPPEARTGRPADGTRSPPSSPGEEASGQRRELTERRTPAGSHAPSSLQGDLAWLDHLEQLIQVADDEEALASSLARLCGQRLQGRGLIVLFTASGLQVVQRYQMEAETVSDLSETLIRRVYRQKAPLICPDVRVDPELGQLKSLRKAQVRSVICCPVLAGDQCLGVIYVDHPMTPSRRGDSSLPSPLTPRMGQLGGQNEAQQETQQETQQGTQQGTQQETQNEALALVRRVADLCAQLLVSLNRRRRLSTQEPDITGLVGVSAPMKALKQWMEWIAESTDPNLTLLLLGETGTGKSHVARAIHARSRRQAGPFETINCAAIPAALFESQMFGHIKGAFTGADIRQEGAFERARGGSLFLDELGEMPLIDQSKLLLVLSTRRFRLLGDSRDKLFDSQLICATNRNLKLEAEAGRFRSDLLRRIHVNVYRIPSLRERGEEDIALLTQHLITQYLVEQRLRKASEPLVALRDFLSREAETLLYQHPWPWNVGELESLFRNELIRRYVRTGGAERIPARVVRETLGLDQPSTPRKGDAPPSLLELLPPALSLQDLNLRLDELKRHYVQQAVTSEGGNQTRAAAALGTHRSVLDDILTGRRRKTRKSGELP